MNFLQLCQKLRQEVGISGTGPTTVSNQTGQYKQVVDWINEAWLYIQTMRNNWRFMWQEFTQDVTGASQDYTITGARKLDLDSLVIYEKAIGVSDKTVLTYVPYGEFRHKYRRTTATTERPTEFTVLPNGKVALNYLPKTTYTIAGDMYRAVQTLSVNEDIPYLPAEYHNAILYQAMMYYADKEDASEVRIDANRKFFGTFNSLIIEQLDDITID